MKHVCAIVDDTAHMEHSQHANPICRTTNRDPFETERVSLVSSAQWLDQTAQSLDHGIAGLLD